MRATLMLANLPFYGGLLCGVLLNLQLIIRVLYYIHTTYSVRTITILPLFRGV